MSNDDFRELIWQEGHEHHRDMPWREDVRPYYVLVSELMLQQTQVERVIPKFQEFIKAFPDEKALAGSELAAVLRLWQGLGYNRRAKFLHEAAKAIGETFPDAFDELIKLPGVGKNTAGAILAYSFNHPAIFVETNIRTVYIHHFFNDQFDIDDKQIIDLLEQTIDHEHPREFYWALMDYGSWLKANGIRNISASKHYKKQSPLTGSIREIRGQIVTALTSGDKDLSELEEAVIIDERFNQALDGLMKDGLVSRTKHLFHLTK